MAMEHYDLVHEMPSIERMTTQDRLKHAKKRRSQQMKKWNQYEKQLEKDNSKKSKKKGAPQKPPPTKPKRESTDRVQFVANIALLESAARNDIDEVRSLLKSKVNPDVTNEDGLTALHQCCIDNNEEMLLLLLEYGANVNACDSEMWTPLHAAATCGHITLCKHLIERGAELLAVNANGNMPYDICEDDTTLDYIESEMAKRGITQEEIDETRLTAEREMLNDLKKLVASGGDLEFKDSVGATFLHIAAANGYMEVAEFLLDNHVAIDPTDNELWQPVHAAAFWGQLDFLELLVQSGADLDAKTNRGETAFDLCEDPDIKQRILDMKDEIETKKANWQRPGSTKKLKHNSRNTSLRRSSLRGEKGNLSKKEAHEEALHFGMSFRQDEEELAVLDEEKEIMSAKGMDDHTVDDEDTNYKTQSSIHKSNNDSLRGNKSSGNSNGKQKSAFADQKWSDDNHENDLTRGQQVDYRDNKKTTADDQFQKMFLETVPQINKHSKNRTSTASVTSTSSQSQPLQFYPPPMMEKIVRNGSVNSSTTTNPLLSRSASTASRGNSSFREGQLRKFVNPPLKPPVVNGGTSNEKEKCCIVS